MAKGEEVLETERLTLRQFTAADGELMMEILNEPDFIRFVADRGVRTISQAEDFIAGRITPSYSEHGFGFYVVELKESGVPIGMCGLIKREGLDDVDVGYSILRPYWRQGYAYEAARAVVDYAKNVVKLPRLVAITSPDNVKSGTLLEKLGLRFDRMVQLPGYENESRLFLGPEWGGT
jgi:RimJ/RimL family protein N-acetyltransferase